ncbi:MAG TPA: glycoside hydrolase family 9 protein [bacterium]|nr:glycoside hydrolase family 9 protein [bacterium]
MNPICLFLVVGLILSACAPSTEALLVDNGEGSGEGLIVHWAGYCDSASSYSPSPFHLSSDGHDSARCARLEFEMRPGAQYPYAGMTCSFTAQDFSTYEGVRFWAKGLGSWSCMLPIPATSKEYNHYSSPVIVTDSWKLYELPFSKFAQSWGTPKPWDPTAVTGVQFNASGNAGDKGWISVDDIEFYKKGEEKSQNKMNNPILPEPKVNQEGYLPGDEKYFVITETPAVKKGDSFQILNETGVKAFSGTLSTGPFDDIKSTGEKVFQGDFTGLTLPGRYTVSIDGLKSVSFSVKANVFQNLFKDALRCFYLIRCGTAIDDPVTGIKHAACHLKDAALKTDPSQHGDFVGGWHNALDYGKWTHMEAISCAWMMWLYELKEKEMAGFKNNIPESPNKMSDLLNEAQWGLTWLLKMQAPDGGVYHKVDSEDHFCFGTVPEKDPYNRYLQGESCIDAGVFTGVMCQAARVYQTLDPAFAQKCLAAAKRSWAWLEKNPDATFQDPDYVDSDTSQEKLWALGEMARMSGDKELENRFTEEATPAKLQTLTWMTPQFFGYMAQVLSPKTTDEEKETITQTLTKICDGLVEKSKTNGYGVCLDPSEYYWGSNENILNKAGALLFAYHLTGEKKYRTTALRQMNYILGLNSLETSFVTGHGEKAGSHPHHWDYASLHIVMPGWAGGGANQYAKGADPTLLGLINGGTPPAKCFFDGPGTTSWASNEGQTVENAALVFDAGYLAEK